MYSLKNVAFKNIVWKNYIKVLCKGSVTSKTWMGVPIFKLGCLFWKKVGSNNRAEQYQQGNQWKALEPRSSTAVKSTATAKLQEKIYISDTACSKSSTMEGSQGGMLIS